MSTTITLGSGRWWYVPAGAKWRKKRMKKRKTI